MKAAHVRQILTRLDRIESRLKDLQGRAPGEIFDRPLTVPEFAAAIGRSAKYPDFVYDEIKQGRIIPLPGKRPLMIPRSELLRYQKVRTSRF
jgi:hypothetical protein